MTLTEWMAWKGLRDKDIAEKLGCSLSQVSRLRRGHCFPSPETLRRVRKMTAGQVAGEDFLDAMEAA